MLRVEAKRVFEKEMTVVPKPVTGIPGHAEIPELNTCTPKHLRKELVRKLASCVIEFCGPYLLSVDHEALPPYGLNNISNQ